jgi:MoaA/NifB/PqqE/SkfB family radical SAM enzyme
VSRLIVELTNRCNLRCKHCYDERHAATGELSLELLRKILREGKACGIDHLSFTGGEPTLHGQLEEVIGEVCAAGYRFSFVSNGSTLPKIYGLLVRHRAQFDGATFSLDGARQETHDSLRGKGSYRQVMRAASVCVAKELPFSLNMVVTARNRGEVGELVDLAARLGSGAVRFGYLMPTPGTAESDLDLPPRERRETEAEIWRLQKSAPLPVAMAPGYFSENPFFRCGPLDLREFNLDYRGNLTLCCQLSGYEGGTPGTDLMGNLHEISLTEAVSRFRQRVETYLDDKRRRVMRRDFTELDHFPCWYCVKYLDKVPRLGTIAHHPWASR